MIEAYEFRLYTRYAARIGVGNELIDHRLVTVVVRGEVGDECYEKIGKLEADLAESGSDRAFAGWKLTRTYNNDEVEGAELFLVKMGYAHLAGDEYGTQYAISTVGRPCSIDFQASELKAATSSAKTDGALDFHCGVSSRQIGPLIVPPRKILKSRDLFLLWSGETIVLDPISTVIQAASGSRLQAISEPSRVRQRKQDGESRASGEIQLAQDGREGSRKSDSHKAKQLIIESKPLEVASQTSFGDNPFRTNTSEHCSCPFGEVPGPRLLSELFVSRSSWDGSDVCATDVHVGSWRGLFRPRRLLVVSKTLYQSLRIQSIRGVEFEIAHMTE